MNQKERRVNVRDVGKLKQAGFILEHRIYHGIKRIKPVVKYTGIDQE